MIPASVFEKIISRLTDLQVVIMDTKIECHFPKQVIEKEILMRTKVCQDALRRLTGVKLRQAAIAPDVAFPNLVNHPKLCVLDQRCFDGSILNSIHLTRALWHILYSRVCYILYSKVC